MGAAGVLEPAAGEVGADVGQLDADRLTGGGVAKVLHDDGGGNLHLGVKEPGHVLGLNRLAGLGHHQGVVLDRAGGLHNVIGGNVGDGDFIHVHVERKKELAGNGLGGRGPIADDLIAVVARLGQLDLVHEGYNDRCLASDQDVETVLDKLGALVRGPGAKEASPLVNVGGPQVGRAVSRSQWVTEMATAESVELAVDGNILVFVDDEPRVHLVPLVGIAQAVASIPGFTDIYQIHFAASAEIGAPGPLPFPGWTALQRSPCP